MSFRGKYGRSHDDQCLCTGCNADYVRHNLQHVGTCDCRDCQKHLANALIRNPKMRDLVADEIDKGRANRGKSQRQIEQELRFARADAKRKEKKVATVNFCEREGCATMGKSDVMGTLVLIPVNGDVPGNIYSDAVNTTGRSITRMELCPGCVGEFMALVGAEVTGERPKAYTEAWKPLSKEANVPTDSATLFRLALEASKKEAGIEE